jgi:nickel/cobalt exporter
MPDIATLLQQGADNAWLFIPSTILMGALHGLEPGHSKTMMAAFIVAVRGTVAQAVMLGLAATVSHTAVVWAVALVGMQLGQGWNAQATEPYFQMASAAVIVLIALWMLWRTWSFQHGRHDHHDHDHDHDHDHAHGATCSHDHGHGHEHEPMDAHARAHAMDIERRFAGREVTNGQILMFGLTGGLIPCPASITVLLLCLQLKKVALGATLVLGFSVGLALTLVASGALAALSMRHASRRWSGFGELAAKAPYASGLLIMLVGLWVGWHGWSALA